MQILLMKQVWDLDSVCVKYHVTVKANEDELLASFVNFSPQTERAKLKTF